MHRQIERRFKRWLIAGGMFNIISSALYIFPGTAPTMLNALAAVHAAVGAGGPPPAEPSTSLDMLFLNGFGNVDTLVGILLIYSAGDIYSRYVIPLLNGIAKILFAGILYYHAFVHGISETAIGFAVVEIAFGVAFLYYLVRLGLVPGVGRPGVTNAG